MSRCGVEEIKTPGLSFVDRMDWVKSLSNIFTNWWWENHVVKISLCFTHMYTMCPHTLDPPRCISESHRRHVALLGLQRRPRSRPRTPSQWKHDQLRSEITACSVTHHSLGSLRERPHSSCWRKLEMKRVLNKRGVRRKRVIRHPATRTNLVSQYFPN